MSIEKYFWKWLQWENNHIWLFIWSSFQCIRSSYVLCYHNCIHGGLGKVQGICSRSCSGPGLPPPLHQLHQHRGDDWSHPRLPLAVQKEQKEVKIVRHPAGRRTRCWPYSSVWLQGDLKEKVEQEQEEFLPPQDFPAFPCLRFQISFSGILGAFWHSVSLERDSTSSFLLLQSTQELLVSCLWYPGRKKINQSIFISPKKVTSIWA